MVERNYCVYSHVNKVNGKQYIGMTNNPRHRWARDGERYENSVRFMGAIRKYGFDNFDHIILFDNLTKQEAFDLEIELIAKYKTQDGRYGYNISPGGQGGNYLDEEQLKIQSKKMRQRNLNPKTNPMTNGRVVWGKTHPYVNSMKVIVTERDGTVREFDLLTDCSNYYGISKAQMNRIIGGSQPYRVKKRSMNDPRYMKIDGATFKSIRMKNGVPIEGEKTG